MIPWEIHAHNSAPAHPGKFFYLWAFAFAVLAFAAALDALVAISRRRSAERAFARPWPPVLAILPPNLAASESFNFP
jgi:hypothetical protein